MPGTNLDTASYTAADFDSVKPLNKPMMQWFFANLTKSPADMQDPKLDLVGKADLHGLPPVTPNMDEVNPLQSEGEALAAKVNQAGVQVDARDYDGVTHEFFGTSLVVDKAKQAQDLAIKNLKGAFGRS